MITLIAGIIVTGVGIKVFLSNPVKDFRDREKGNKSLWRDFYSVFVLSITNPYTILIFVAIFPGIHISGNTRPEDCSFFSDTRSVDRCHDLVVFTELCLKPV